MFSRLLIPFPPDSPDVSVASYGVQLAEQFNAELVVLSVLDRPQQRDQIRSDQEEQARQASDPLLELAADRGIATERIITTGEADETIITTVKDHNIDLVVMGTRARTGVDRVLLGSVAESVVRESPVPVLTVTPDAVTALELPSGQDPGPP